MLAEGVPKLGTPLECVDEELLRSLRREVILVGVERGARGSPHARVVVAEGSMDGYDLGLRTCDYGLEVCGDGRVTRLEVAGIPRAQRAGEYELRGGACNSPCQPATADCRRGRTRLG